MHRLLALLFSAAAFLPAAEVRFAVTSSFGDPIAYRVVSFVQTTTGHDLAGSFEGLRAINIERGTYRYVLRPTPANAGLEEISDTLAVSEPIVLIPRAARPKLPMSTGVFIVDPTTYANFEGRLQPAPSRDCLAWGTLHGIFIPMRRTLPVSPDGRFQAERIPIGSYVLTFQSCKGPLASALIDVYSNLVRPRTTNGAVTFAANQ